MKNVPDGETAVEKLLTFHFLIQTQNDKENFTLIYGIKCSLYLYCWVNIECFFFCLTYKRQPSVPTDAQPALRPKPYIWEFEKSMRGTIKTFALIISFIKSNIKMKLTKGCPIPRLHTVYLKLSKCRVGAYQSIRIRKYLYFKTLQRIIVLSSSRYSHQILVRTFRKEKSFPVTAKRHKRRRIFFAAL